MAIWQARIESTAGAKYLGIVAALQADIYSGYVKAGDQLPTQRQIAAQLQVDLTTVTRAFNEAKKRGLIEATTGRGSFVRQHVEAKLITHITAQNPLLDLSMNNPPQPASADLQHAIPEGIQQLISGAERVLQLHYQDSAGNPQDRQAAADWLNQTLSGITVNRTLITAGAQAALYAIFKCISQQGDGIACGEFVYPGLKAVADEQNLQLYPVKMDKKGMLPDAFEALCQQQAISVLYVVPAMDNPTMATLPLARLQQLVEIARSHKVLIIEDDPYSILMPERDPAFVELAPELTWHIRTLAKCITPALRLAYVVSPTESLAREVANFCRAASVMVSPLMSALVTSWIVSGKINQFAEAISQENHLRQQLAQRILAGMDYSADSHGHHLWLRLPAHWQAEAFTQQARLLGVSVVASTEFAVTDNPVAAVRLSIGLMPDLVALEQALSILKMLLNQPASPRRTIV